ncbi:MAG: tyrosine--tRNA ligase [Deltaproteobacteria bacterium]|nr:tyrosine--tRNA ligase [Deltaproteobacteria bacterium]
MPSFAHPKEQLDVIGRGIDRIVERKELLAKLSDSCDSGRPLRVAAGFDPSSPDLHLGHTVVLRMLRRFQELGHDVIVLLGDFTARYGDPTDQLEPRPRIDAATIRSNAESYKQQMARLLDMKRTRFVFNSSWLEDLSLERLLQAAAHIGLPRMTGRPDLGSRSDLRLDELIYPLLQAYDSVHLELDLEIGGTDQLANLLLGRELMIAMCKAPQCIITTELLEGTDAYLDEGQFVGNKMSQRLANTITLGDSKEEIQTKVEGLDEALVWRYFDLLTDCSFPQIRAFQADRESGKRSVEEIRAFLTEEIIAGLGLDCGEHQKP